MNKYKIKKDGANLRCPIFLFVDIIFFAFLANLKQKEGKKLLLQNNKKQVYNIYQREKREKEKRIFIEYRSMGCGLFAPWDSTWNVQRSEAD